MNVLRMWEETSVAAMMKTRYILAHFRFIQSEEGVWAALLAQGQFEWRFCGGVLASAISCGQRQKERCSPREQLMIKRASWLQRSGNFYSGLAMAPVAHFVQNEGAFRATAVLPASIRYAAMCFAFFLFWIHGLDLRCRNFNWSA